MQTGSTRRTVNSAGSSRPDSSRPSLPNRSIARSKIVRKAIPPFPTSLPLVEETALPGPSSHALAHMLDKVNGNTTPIPQRRPVLSVQTDSPFPKINGRPMGRSAVARPKFDPMRTFRNSFLGKQTDGGESPAETRPTGKGKARETGEDSPETVRQNKLSVKAREIRAWMMGKSGSEMHLSAVDAIKKAAGNDEPGVSTRMRQTVGGMRDLFKNRKPAPTPKDRGPKAGQTYEIVNHRIIEANPERTVEISTWREQASERPRSNEERMSIYYLSADEYPQEGDYAVNETVAKVEWRVDASDIPPEGMGYSQTSPERLVAAELPPNSKRSLVSPQYQHSLSANVEPPLPPTPHERTISPTTSEKDRSSSAKGSHIEVTIEHVDMATGGSSTPVKHSTHRSRQRHRRLESNSMDKELPRSPYIHARSGSTVSTVKSNASIQFEGVLRSCEPSLMHIAPILRNLGIQKIEHLRAITRLSPSIRDREVKENALRQGITVIEWAILLDKLNTL